MLQNKTHTMLTADQAIQLAEMFRLMGDPKRLRILLACLDGPIAVGDLVKATAASPSLVSHHLRLLRAARILRAERRGRHVYYATADAHIRDMLIGMAAHVGEEEDQ